MKRITLLTAILILTAMTVFAEHEYIPFATPGKQWVEYRPTEECMRTINGDTVIENVPYQRLELYRRPIYLSPRFEISYIREADKKVYLKRTLSKPEELIYDFNLQPGDSITIAPKEEGEQEYTIYMDSIKTNVLNGLERNYYYVHYKDQWSDFEQFYSTDRWIEGIGTVDLSILCFNGRYTYIGGFFSYYYEPETSFIYPEYKTPVDFSALPTVLNDDARISRNGNCLTSNGTLSLYDLSGSCLANGSCIDLSDFPKGVYIVRSYSTDGRATLAR